MRVQEIGRTVECHDRLARPGSALDHEDARQRGADDLVLFALDGRDDVAEATRAGLLHGGGKRHLAFEHRPVEILASAVAEELVLDAEQCSASGREVARRAKPMGSRPVAR